MRTLFLGHFAASVAPRILAKTEMPLETQILGNEGDAAQLAPLLAGTEIVVGHIWRAGFPPAPRLRLLQSVAAGLDLLDTSAVPKGVTICNVFGHEPAVILYLTDRIERVMFPIKEIGHADPRATFRPRLPR